LSQTTENRDYDHSYFGDYSSDGANGIDYSLSSTADIKLYENHVRVSMQNMSESVLNDYLDYTTTVVLDQWTYLPTPTTFEVRFSLQVNEDLQVFVFADGVMMMPPTMMIYSVSAQPHMSKAPAMPRPPSE
jgi:hypothetical protein